MMSAFFWGVVATCSLILGGIIALRYTLSHRALGVIMAFGAGALISAVSYELIGDAISIARGTGFPMMGLFAGALTYYFSDKLVATVGPSNPHEIAPSGQSSLLIPMVLAIILDGVPESIVIGLGIFKGGSGEPGDAGGGLSFEPARGDRRNHRHEGQRLEQAQDHHSLGSHRARLRPLHCRRQHALQRRIGTLARLHSGVRRRRHPPDARQLDDAGSV